MNRLNLSSNTLTSSSKPKREMNSFSPNRNSFLRVIIYIVIAVICLLFLIGFFNKNEKLVLLTIEKDRAKSYNVKVIPASYSDEKLNTLPKESYSYLAMIDAGSSGCRAHVYRYGKLGEVSGPLYILPNHVSKKVKPGLSSFAANPKEAGKSLQGLIDFLREQVPETDWNVTPIWLKATAGLRMLPLEKSAAIIQSVRDFLSNKKNSPFLFRLSWASVISGNEEGGFGWIAFNYLKKIIGPKKNPKLVLEPYAVIEMGGASSQVSQLAPNPIVAEQIPSEYRFTFTIESEEYHLYTHSYLGFGAEQAREQLNSLLLQDAKANTNSETISDPCLNTGYTSIGSRKEAYEGPMVTAKAYNVNGVADKGGICQSYLQTIFNTINQNSAGKCPTIAASTSISSKMIKVIRRLTGIEQYSFGCTYQPDFIKDSSNILLFENFYYMSSAIGVKSTFLGSVATTSSPTVATNSERYPLVTTPLKILEATHSFCGTNWNEVFQSYPLDNQGKDTNIKMCFIGSYAYEFIVDGLKIPKDKYVTIQREVDSSEIEWALGAAYKEAAEFLKRTNLRPT